ncbi:hypothetical protein MCC93_21130 [Morococcus cerebrosus]|uniref:Uncharacterized protein n=1 Tax=Morococcus cerebrosus TaxID=1056807 RepID=A0A0C1GX69_9NEIS|nr:hypothetical protein MCC93_21130 [Morococcus cerebrosus]
MAVGAVSKNSGPVINFQTTFLLMIQRSSENIGQGNVWFC